MPFRIEFSRKNNGVVALYTGDVTDEDLIGAYREIVSSETDVSKLKYSVTDFVDVDNYRISPECIRKQARLAIEFSKINPNFTVIVIAPRDVEYGSSRMWSAYSDEAGWDVRIFRNRDDANQWIDGNM